MFGEKSVSAYARYVLSNGVRRLVAIVALAAIFLFAAAAGYSVYLSPAPVIPPPLEDLPAIQLKGQTVRVSVADTETERQQGLSGRTGLATDEGMLFVFPQDGEHAFWMKDMRFSIDILWISASGEVVYMAENVSPGTYPKSFRSDVPARYVLELPAGYAEAHAVEIGDRVEF